MLRELVTKGDTKNVEDEDEEALPVLAHLSSALRTLQQEGGHGGWEKGGSGFGVALDAMRAIGRRASDAWGGAARCPAG